MSVFKLIQCTQVRKSATKCTRLQSGHYCSPTLLKTGCTANTFLGVGPTLAMPPPTGCYVTPPGVYYTHHSALWCYINTGCSHPTRC